jgi:hypothetical protein
MQIRAFSTDQTEDKKGFFSFLEAAKKADKEVIMEEKLIEQVAASEIAAQT